jgi:uncharacterized pyridoxamine 5'-phosphate oxidase family protein
MGLTIQDKVNSMRGSRIVALPIVALLIALCFGGLAHADEKKNLALEDYTAFLTKFPAGVLATVEGEQPRTRIFSYLWTENGKAYFCTGISKAVYQQLQKNNRVSFCTWDPATATVLSLDGPVTFVNDKALKQKVLNERPFIRDLYKSADNPEFTVFYLDPESIYTYDFANGKQYIKE